MHLLLSHPQPAAVLWWWCCFSEPGCDLALDGYMMPSVIHWQWQSGCPSHIAWHGITINCCHPANAAVSRYHVCNSICCLTSLARQGHIPRHLQLLIVVRPASRDLSWFRHLRPAVPSGPPALMAELHADASLPQGYCRPAAGRQAGLCPHQGGSCH